MTYGFFDSRPNYKKDADNPKRIERINKLRAQRNRVQRKTAKILRDVRSGKK